MSRFACHYILVDVSSMQAFACSNSARWCQRTVFGTLFLRCCAVTENVSAWWVVWCLDRPETVFRSALLLLLCRLRHTVVTPEPNDGLQFFCHDVISLCKEFVENLFKAFFISLNWNLLKFKRVICLWKSAATLLPIISLDKLGLWHTSLSWCINDVKKDVHKDLY